MLLNKLKSFILIGFTILQACSVHRNQPRVSLPKPSPVQYTWHEQERLMFIHFGMATWQAREYDNFSTDISQINPTKIDTDEWCRVAQSFGAKQIVFVAKHVGGFCWWPTETTDYNVQNTAWKNGKGDLVADVAASCKKFGLNLGIYLYPGDDKWGAGLGSGGKTKDPAKQEAYNKIYRQQLLELLTRYGTITEVWFDGTCVIDVKDILDAHARKAVIFQSPQASIRWVGNEEGHAPYPAWNSVKSSDLQTGVSTAAHSDPNGDAWAPLEVDVPLYNHNWFWSPANEKKRRSLNELMEIYYKSVGRGAVLLLNATPDTNGVIPADDVARFAAFGKEIDRRFSKPLQAKYSLKDGVAQLVFDTPMVVNHVVVMEDYRWGERIREYVIEGKVNNQWEIITTGSSIGRKKIDYFPGKKVSALRIIVTKSAAKPITRSFAAYNVTGADELIDHRAAPKNEWQYLSSWTPSAAESSNDTSLTLDLSSYIPVPGQYQLKIETPDGNGTVITSAELWYDGEKALDAFLSATDHIVLINRTAQVTSETQIEVKLWLKAAKGTGESSSIYFRKVD